MADHDEHATAGPWIKPHTNAPRLGSERKRRGVRRGNLRPAFLVAVTLGSAPMDSGCAEADAPDAREQQTMPDRNDRPPAGGGSENAQPPVGGSADTSSMPVTVDLRRLPPQSQVSGEEREAPAPGVPDPRPRLVRDAKVDLGARVGADVSEIELVSIEATEWPDTSLGCPRPGEQYAQVQTSGYRMTLVFGNREYIYHSDRVARVVRCPALNR